MPFTNQEDIYYNRLNEMTPRGPSNNPFYGSVGMKFVAPDQRGDYGSDTNDYWKDDQGQLMYRMGDPSALNNSWVPQSTRDALVNSPLFGNSLNPKAAAGFQDPIRANAAKDDAHSARMWGLGAAAMGGLPMAAHGAFGAGLQGMLGGSPTGGGGSWLDSLTNFFQSGNNPFSSGAPVSDIFPSMSGAEGFTSGIGAEGSVAGGSNPFGPGEFASYNPTSTSLGETGAFDMGQFSPTDVGLPGYGSSGSGGGFTDFLKQFFPGISSSGGTSGSSLLGDVLKAGGNYFLQSSLADKYQEAALAAANKANTLDAPQRQGYQAQLAQLLSNPSQFYATNPVVKAQLDLAKQKFYADTGKMGTGGTQFDNYLRNVQNVASSTFNDQANLLGMLGGFNQGAGYTGNVYANMSAQGLQQQGEAYRGLGDKDIFNRIFGGLLDMSSPSPSGTKITSSY